jgi:hypothetical protein
VKCENESSIVCLFGRGGDLGLRCASGQKQYGGAEREPWHHFYLPWEVDATVPHPGGGNSASLPLAPLIGPRGDADPLLLRENPVEDTQRVRDVRDVVASGHWYSAENPRSRNQLVMETGCPERNEKCGTS